MTTRFINKNIFPVAFLLTALVVIVTFFVTTSVSGATILSKNKIQCFDGYTDGLNYGGKCTLSSNGIKLFITLDNSNMDEVSDYSGIYIENSNTNGLLLQEIKQAQFDYLGTEKIKPGVLGLNIPLDTNDDGLTDNYVYIDASDCTGEDGGHVDIINNRECKINFDGSEYKNWEEFIKGNSKIVVASSTSTEEQAHPFIMAERIAGDGPITWSISNVNIAR